MKIEALLLKNEKGQDVGAVHFETPLRYHAEGLRKRALAHGAMEDRGIVKEQRLGRIVVYTVS